MKEKGDENRSHFTYFSLDLKAHRNRSKFIDTVGGFKGLFL
jgi:hypothetical protein